MTEARQNHPAAWRAALLFVVAMLAACADADGAPRDVFAGLRTQAENPLPPLALREAGGVAEVGQQGGARPAVQGFVRRGRPAVVTAGSDRAPLAEIGEFTVNFENAPLADVIRAMIEDGLGASYVLDPGVTGNVTIRTNSPLTRSQILPTLEEILRLNDAAIVERGGVFQILPRQQAGLSAPLIDARNIAARGLTTRVTPLRNVGVEDLREVLERFAPVAGSITFDPGRNLVFSIGSMAEQATIADLIGLLDADAFAGRSFALTPLRNADPDSVAEEMAQIFPPSARLRFVPVERMSAVLTIAETPNLLDEALSILRSLDQGGRAQMQLYVYPVENRSAAELAQVLGGVFGVQTSGGASQGRTGALAPSLTASLSSGAAQTDGAADALLAADPMFGADGMGGGGSGGGGSEGVARIAADEASNTIVALADADGARRVQNALRRLDRQPLQVMIQATLAEVVLNDQLEYGVRWFFESGNWRGSFSDATTGAIRNVVGTALPGFSAVFDTGDIRLALNALDEITDVRLLSTPTLMVLDGRIARLQVGDQVPVQTRSATSVENPDAPIVTETEFRDTGVILTVRPRINPNGLVVLEMRQEVSDVVPVTGSANPTFQQRVVESTVAVDSGDTVAIGGLIRERASGGRAGIPILHDVPVAGALFGARDRRNERTELIVLLTPMVVRDQRGARAATDELRARLTGIYGPAATR